jgi:GWxTD domain-containing protein
MPGVQRLGVTLAVLLFSATIAAQSLPELFHKAKAQVKGESWTEALKTLDALEAEANRPGNADAKQQLAAPLAFYRGVCDASLGNASKAQADFETFLALKPKASMDPSMYSKKVIAAFDAARKNAAPEVPAEERHPIFQAFQEFKLPPNASEQVNAVWADGPVKWIMTPEEKRGWDELAGGAEWQDFVDRFWESRNPRPGNPDNAFKTTFERRVAYADAHFVQVEGTRGSLTERGMVFVVLGPPSYIGRRPIRTGEEATTEAGMSTVGSRATAYAQRMLTSAGEPAGSSSAAATDAVFGPGTKAADSSSDWREIWHYPSELLPRGVSYQKLAVEFVTKKGFGKNVLQRDYKTLATLDAAKTRAN